MGKECVGCGYCCVKAPCPIALRIYGNGITKCPELIWNGTRHICRLCTLPLPLGNEYRKELSVGEGCCSSLNTWRTNIINRIPVEFKPTNVLTSEFQDFLFALGTQSFISGDAIWLTIWSFKKMLLKRGYNKEEVETIGEQVNFYIKQNKPSFVESLMG